MSDIYSSSTVEVNSVTVDKLLYGNESIGYAIRPELVSRISLHPTIIDGNLEKRVYYSLHNDAGDCVYVSPFITSPEPNGTNYPTIIPGEPSTDLNDGPNFNNPPVPPIMENPPVEDDGEDDGDDNDDDIVKVIWPPVVTGDENEEDDDWQTVTGTGGYSGGNGSGGGENGFQAPSYATDFSDYAEKLAGGSWDGYYPTYPINGKTSNVFKFFETTQAAINMDNAMAYTRDEYKGLGLKVIGVMPKVVTAENMYRGSVIHEHTGSFPKLVNAKGMFRDCPSLTKVYVTNGKGAANIEDASYMFDSDTSLTSVTLNAMTHLTKVDYMFYGCSSLKLVDMTIGNRLTSGFCMFTGCSSLRNRVSFPSAMTNGAFMYDGCESLPGDYPSLSNIVDGRAMFRNNKNITYIDLYLPALVDGTHMFSGCSATSIAGEINLRNLQYGNCMVKDARFSIYDVNRIMEELDKYGSAMPAINPNGNVQNGLQIGMLVTNEGSGSSTMTLEDFESNWSDKYDSNISGYRLSTGWIITINKFQSI